MNERNRMGIPDDLPGEIEEVTMQDNLFEQDEALEEEEYEKALAEAGGRFGVPGIARELLGAKPLMLLLACVLLLVLFTQSLSLVRQLETLPPALRGGGYVLLGLLLVGVGVALWRLSRVFARLKTTPGVPVKTIQALAQRAELRRQAGARLSQAGETLKKFLGDYPLEEGSDALNLLARGLEPNEIGKLRVDARALASEELFDPEDWLERFDRRFLVCLDTAARRCIRRYALRVGIKTAALPSGFDTAIVLLNAFLMARDLCVIYNLRTNGPGTMAVMLRVMFNVFAAGQVSNLAESAADMLFESGGVVAGVGKAISARTAEGSVNSLLFMRLGAAMVRHLRPIWPPAGR